MICRQCSEQLDIRINCKKINPRQYILYCKNRYCNNEIHLQEI